MRLLRLSLLSQWLLISFILTAAALAVVVVAAAKFQVPFWVVGAAFSCARAGVKNNNLQFIHWCYYISFIRRRVDLSSVKLSFLMSCKRRAPFPHVTSTPLSKWHSFNCSLCPISQRRMLFFFKQKERNESKNGDK